MKEVLRTFVTVVPK
ncbi:unnamed protein product [Acanthoscelides obtectus]|uniref:Uncharacterized protein n=1 Tax=Acanthoscelides obtectus TaxID=200917 RepID=A0A9P0MFA8_ACAOB|nr:unnamed protein product [Acanthoscelides obtectus]